MKVLGVWFIIIVACAIAIVMIENIDDLSSLVRDDSLWWHLPVFLVGGYTVINSGIIIFNRIFG